MNLTARKRKGTILTDYLLVHGAGQGAWSWGRVWGHLTAPLEHPPRLNSNPKINKVIPIDLPAHGSDAGRDTSGVLAEECINAIVNSVERENMANVVLVGHDFSAPLVLKASLELPHAPKRVILVSGVIPDTGKDMVSVLPFRFQVGFKLYHLITSLFGKDMYLPKELINRYMCNDVDPKEIIQTIGFYRALPTRILKTKFDFNDSNLVCPVTYIVLSQDKMIPPTGQRKMAERIPNVDIIEIEGCHQSIIYNADSLAGILGKYS